MVTASSPLRRVLAQSQAAALLRLPFLAVYRLSLVCAFFRGIWISLYDRNLLAVAFNPDAKVFVWIETCIKVMQGKNVVWSPWIRLGLRTMRMLGLAAAVDLYRTRRLSRATALAISIASALLLFARPPPRRRPTLVRPADLADRGQYAGLRRPYRAGCAL